MNRCGGGWWNYQAYLHYSRSGIVLSLVLRLAISVTGSRLDWVRRWKVLVRQYCLGSGMARSRSRLAVSVLDLNVWSLKSLPSWMLVPNSFFFQAGSAHSWQTWGSIRSWWPSFWVFFFGEHLDTKFVLLGRAWPRGFYRTCMFLQFVDFSWSDWNWLVIIFIWDRCFREGIRASFWESDRAK